MGSEIPKGREKMKKTSLSDALGGTLGGVSPNMHQGVLPTGQNHNMPFGNVEGNFPPGQYENSIHNAVSPFAGQHMLPTGQSINVSMNAPNPNLSFREWVARGFVGAIGEAFAWPFQLVARIIEESAKSLVNLATKLVMFILLPTMLYMGYLLAMNMSQAGSVEEGAAQMVYHGRHAANGIATGFSGELPPEKKKNEDTKD